MQLRKTIKRPQRYEPEPFPAATARASSSLEVTSELRPEIIEYNPNLPAAAFPTLPVIPTRPQAHAETAEDPNSKPRQNVSQPQTYDEPDSPDGDKAQFEHNLAKLNELSKLTEEDWSIREMESSVDGDAAENESGEHVNGPLGLYAMI